MSPKTMKLLAKPMLFAAAIIWGTSFFIMKNALDALPPFYLLAIRFTAGAVLLALIAWKKWQIFTWDHLWRGAVMGAFLFLAYSIQTFGLTLTTPSKNAFLTAVYCVLVPFLSWAVIRVRPDRFNIAAALLCVTGVGFVSLGMRWHLLAVHDDFTADIDVLPNLPLKSRADVGLVQNADPRFQSLVGFQRLWRVVEPDQHVDVGVAGSLKLQNPVIVKHAVPFHVLKPAL